MRHNLVAVIAVALIGTALRELMLKRLKDLKAKFDQTFSLVLLLLIYVLPTISQEVV